MRFYIHHPKEFLLNYCCGCSLQTVLFPLSLVFVVVEAASHHRIPLLRTRLRAGPDSTPQTEIVIMRQANSVIMVQRGRKLGARPIIASALLITEAAYSVRSCLSAFGKCKVRSAGGYQDITRYREACGACSDMLGRRLSVEHRHDHEESLLTRPASKIMHCCLALATREGRTVTSFLQFSPTCIR